MRAFVGYVFSNSKAMSIKQEIIILLEIIDKFVINKYITIQ
jgi:hypothetical protein